MTSNLKVVIIPIPILARVRGVMAQTVMKIPKIILIKQQGLFEYIRLGWGENPIIEK